MEKTGCRRRKIEYLDDSRARSVTFVKRREGLFRKASELAVLCGAQCAIITFNQRGSPFVFGHPSADAVIDRFAGRPDRAVPFSGGPDQILSEYKAQDVEAVGRLESAKKKKKRRLNPEVTAVPKESRFWWDDPQLIDDMEEENELELYISEVEELRRKVRERMEEVKDDAAAAVAEEGDNNPTPLIESCFDSTENASEDGFLLTTESAILMDDSNSGSSDAFDWLTPADELPLSDSKQSAVRSTGDFWETMSQIENIGEDEEGLLLLGTFQSQMGSTLLYYCDDDSGDHNVNVFAAADKLPPETTMECSTGNLSAETDQPEPHDMESTSEDDDDDFLLLDQFQTQSSLTVSYCDSGNDLNVFDASDELLPETTMESSSGDDIIWDALWAEIDLSESKMESTTILNEDDEQDRFFLNFGGSISVC